MAEVLTGRCPRCGAAINADPRFVAWCAQCEWNLDGRGDAMPAVSRREKAAITAGERLEASLEKSDVTRPRLSAARAASYVVAAVIHLATLAVLVLGAVVLVANFPSVFAFVVGIPLLLLGLLLRPRLGAIRAGTVLLPRESAPALYGVADRVAAAIGAKPVDVIALEPYFNASYATVGLRRRRVVTIGLALWQAMTEEQRIAVLGHELAHQVNGDSAHGIVVGSALRTLDEWHRAMGSPRFGTSGAGTVLGGIDAIAQVIAAQLMRLIRAGVDALFDFELSLLRQSTQRAEYLADVLGARVASTAATVAALDALYLARPCGDAVRYAARHGDADIWASGLAYFRSISPMEWERRRRLETKAGTAVDATHPPTNLRIRLQNTKPPQNATVDVSATEWEAIAVEMASGFDLVGSQLKERLAR